MECSRRVALLLVAVVAASTASPFRIHQPRDTLHCYTGDTIALLADISDSIRAAVPGLGVDWQSDLMGGAGSGEAISLVTRTAGEYWVMAYLADSAGTHLTADSVMLDVWHFDSVHIYCAGRAASQPSYWLDGELFVANQPELQGRYFRSMVCDSTGFYFLEDDQAFPRYWENGVPRALDSSYGLARGLAIANGSVIAVGWTRGPDGIGRACMWQSGHKTQLLDTLSTAEAVAIRNDTTFIAGRVSYGNLALWRGSSYSVVVPADTYYNYGATIDHIFATANGIYIGASMYWPLPDAGAGALASFYWHEDTLRFLMFDTSRVNPFVYPNHIYTMREMSFFANDDGWWAVAFTEYGGAPFLFHNGIPLEWPESRRDSLGYLTFLSRPFAIYVHRGHVFIAGRYRTESGAWRNCYWRNWKRYDLEDPADGAYSRVYSMCVTDRRPGTSVRRSHGQATSRSHTRTQCVGILHAQVTTPERVSVTFVLAQAGRTDVTLTDCLGRLVASRALGRVPAGRNVAVLELPLLTAGTYLLRVHSQRNDADMRIVVGSVR